MHILELPSFFSPYGGEFCLEQAKALVLCGHTVRIASHLQLGISCGWCDYLTRPYGLAVEQMEGIEVWRSYQRGIPKVIRPNVERWLAGAERLVETYVQQYGVPDLIHAHCTKWAGRAAMLLSARYGVPYVITEHLPAMIYESELGQAPSVAWQTPLLVEAMRRAHCVVFVSEEQRDELVPYFGDHYRSEVISNVIDTDYFHVFPRKPSSDFRFCALGNFIPRKGYDLLSQAFHALRRQGYLVCLTVAGRDTDSRSCRQMMQGDVSCLGELCRDQVRQLLASSDALILPSRSESQGLVVLEALSTGIPVVTTDAVPHSVRLLPGCLSVRSNDAQALMEGMRKAASLSFEPERLSAAVRRYCSPQVVGCQLSRLFQSL